MPSITDEHGRHFWIENSVGYYRATEVETDLIHDPRSNATESIEDIIDPVFEGKAPAGYVMFYPFSNPEAYKEDEECVVAVVKREDDGVRIERNINIELLELKFAPEGDSEPVYFNKEEVDGIPRGDDGDLDELIKSMLYMIRMAKNPHSLYNEVDIPEQEELTRELNDIINAVVKEQGAVTSDNLGFVVDVFVRRMMRLRRIG